MARRCPERGHFGIGFGKGVVLLAILGMVAGAGVASAQADACAAPEARQLDFWLGTWSVSWTEPDGTRREGVNVVQRVLGSVTVRQGKGRRDRVVPVGERAGAWIAKYVREARPDFVIEPDDATSQLRIHVHEGIERLPNHREDEIAHPQQFFRSLDARVSPNCNRSLGNLDREVSHPFQVPSPIAATAMAK